VICRSRKNGGRSIVWVTDGCPVAMSGAPDLRGRSHVGSRGTAWLEPSVREGSQRDFGQLENGLNVPLSTGGTRLDELAKPVLSQLS
jgi:hypothetical protein